MIKQLIRFLSERFAVTTAGNMKYSILIFAVILPLLSGMTNSLAAREIRISHIPATAEDYIAMRDEIATTPEGGAAMFIVAMMGFSKSQDLGMQFMTIALDQRHVTSGNSYRGYMPGSSIMYHINRMNRSHVWSYTAFAYVRGTSPENSYRTAAPYIIDTSRNRFSGEESSGRVKVFVNVYGVSPRPITLQQNNQGIWKAYEASSMFLNVEAPATEEPDPL